MGTVAQAPKKRAAIAGMQLRATPISKWCARPGQRSSSPKLPLPCGHLVERDLVAVDDREHAARVARMFLADA